MFDPSIRVVASLFRRFFVSLRYFVPSSRPPIRPVVSSPRWLRSLVCHSSRCFASLMFPFVVSLRLFDRVSLWTRIAIIRPWITWSSWLTGKYGELVKGWRNWKPGMPECHVFANFAVHSEVAVLFGSLKFIMHVSFMSDHTDSWISSLSNQMCRDQTQLTDSVISWWGW